MIRGLGSFCILALALNAALPPLRTVPSVDLERYAGKWFEIARFPNRFQKICVGNVTARYVKNPDSTVKVVNSCQTKNGKLDEAEGLAKPADEAKPNNARLKVRFAPAFLSFLPAVWGDYQVIALDSNYSHAMVGTPDRKYLWILSRTETLPDSVYQKLLAEAKSQGFETGRLVRTPQE